MTPSEQRIWDATFAAEFVSADWTAGNDVEAAHEARAVADRAVRALRALRQAEGVGVGVVVSDAAESEG